MPYRFEENHPRCDDGEVALVQDNTDEHLGCHPDEESAREQMRAIEANKDIMHPESLLVSPVFGELKDMNDKGKFGGKLVMFGSEEKHDFERDYFNMKTNFWMDGKKMKTAVLYDHGQDENLGKTRLDQGNAEIVVKKDAGVFLQTQLERRNKYEEAVQELAKRGKLGLSSGTASHLVEREVTGTNKQGQNVTHIKQWPLGLDASLTPEPAEPRTKVEPVENASGKSIKRYLEENGVSTEPEKSTVSVLSNFEGTKATQEEIDERYEEFTDAVNMSASEIESWGETECADKASNKPQTVRNRVVKLLRTNKDNWGDSEYEDAGRVISFISRMKGVDGGDKPSEDCPTKKEISLRNWGYDPTKRISRMMKEIDELTGKAEHDYSRGDLVAWNDGSAQGRIREVVGPDDSVSPSTTDRSFSGNEDEDGYLIELVDYDEENDEVVGREETVFHLAGTLSSISKEDVKGLVSSILSDVEELNKQFGSKDSSGQGPDVMAEIENELDSLIENTS